MNKKVFYVGLAIVLILSTVYIALNAGGLRQVIFGKSSLAAAKTSTVSNPYFEILGLKGNRYPFKELWGDKYSDKSKSLVVSMYYPDNIRYGMYEPMEKDGRYYKITTDYPLNSLIYETGTVKDFPSRVIQANFDDDWKIVQLSDFQYGERNKLLKTITIDFDNKGNETNRTEE